MSSRTFLLGARIGTALILLALLVFGVRPDTGNEQALQVTSTTSPAALAEALASRATGPVTYRDSIPPTRAIAGLLATGAVQGRAVSLGVDHEPSDLSVRAPVDPVAQRRTALTVTVRGHAEAPVRVTIEDGAGQVDTVTVPVDPTGTTTTRVAVEPARAGLERWTVSAAGDTASVAAWIRPAAILRVLVLTGPPDWETRYLVRALESSGVDVVVRQELGRDLVVSSDYDVAPADPADLAAFDVVVASGERDPSSLATLSRWVQDAGGGLLLLEGGGTTANASSQPFRATDLTWSGPAELLPLPALAMDIRGTPVSPSEDFGGVSVVSDAVGTVLVTAATLGRGRVLRSGLNSWPWVLEGGAEAAHGDWWESAVEWLAGGLTRDALVSGGTVQPYTVWEGRLEGRVPSALTVRFDDGAAGLDILRIARDRGVVRFVPTVTGAHTFSAAEESALGATVVLDGTERLTWAGAALEVGGGAGALIPANDAATVDGTPLDSGDGRSWLFFLFLTALMGAGWTVRRLQGLG